MFPEQLYVQQNSFATIPCIHSRHTYTYTAYFSVLKREMRVTFADEDVQLLHHELKQLDELAYERGVYRQCCIFHPKHYLVSSIRHFTSVNPKDILVRGDRLYLGESEI